MHIQIHTDTKASKCYIKKKKYHRSFSRFMSDVVENRETERLKHKKKKKFLHVRRETRRHFYSPNRKKKARHGSDPLFLHEEKGGGGREEEVRTERVSSVNK